MWFWFRDLPNVAPLGASPEDLPQDREASGAAVGPPLLAHFLSSWALYFSGLVQKFAGFLLGHPLRK